MKRKEEIVPLARRSWQGLGTIEVIIIISILIAVAMIFSNKIREFAVELMNRAFNIDPLTHAN